MRLLSEEREINCNKQQDHQLEKRISLFSRFPNSLIILQCRRVASMIQTNISSDFCDQMSQGGPDFLPYDVGMTVGRLLLRVGVGVD